MSRGGLFGKEFFDSGRETSATYATYTRSSMLLGFERMASRLVSMFNPRKVLDIGCAKGFLVLAFRNLGVESYGVDVSEYAISQAPSDVRPYLAQVDLDRDSLPFEDRSFDLITALGVLEFLDNHPRALSEVMRVIDDDGVLYVEFGYKKWYQKDRLACEKYQIKLHDSKAWTRMIESQGFEFIPTTTADCFYSVKIQDLLEQGTNPKIRVARCISKCPRLGKSILIQYLTRKTGVGTLLFRPRKLA